MEQMPKPETFRRMGKDFTVIEELAEETFGALNIDPEWFEMVEGWTIHGNTAQGVLTTYLPYGGYGPEQYVVTLTVERTDAHKDYDG